MLGGLFPIHEPKPVEEFMHRKAVGRRRSQYEASHDAAEDETDFEINTCCGKVQSERGIQRLEAMLYAIDLINNDTKLLKNIKLGAKIYDSCDQEIIALEKSTNFVKNTYLMNEENFSDRFICFSNQPNVSNYEKTVLNSDFVRRSKVVGVVGASSSSLSMHVSQFLRLFKVI
jgi:hypothetical protein